MHNLITANQLKTQSDGIIPCNGHDANLDRQDGLEEAPLHDAVLIGVAIEYLYGDKKILLSIAEGVCTI